MLSPVAGLRGVAGMTAEATEVGGVPDVTVEAAEVGGVADVRVEATEALVGEVVLKRPSARTSPSGATMASTHASALLQSLVWHDVKPKLVSGAPKGTSARTTRQACVEKRPLQQQQQQDLRSVSFPRLCRCPVLALKMTRLWCDCDVGVRGGGSVPSGDVVSRQVSVSRVAAVPLRKEESVPRVRCHLACPREIIRCQRLIVGKKEVP